MTAEEAQELIDKLWDEVPACSNVTRDNKRCCACNGCGHWQMMLIAADEIESFF
jgi:predicted metal-dependent hydrolase